MHLQSQARPAIAALIGIASIKGRQAVPLHMLADRLAISVSYLEVMFLKLRLAGLVTSVRGPNGGYLLTRPLKKITVAEVVVAIEGSSNSQTCKPAKLGEDLWEAIEAEALQWLRAVNLADTLKEDQQALQEKLAR